MPSDLAMQANLITLYSTPGRYYHTFQHVQDCLRELYWLRLDVSIDPKQAMIAEFAIWFHDAVYDPKQTDGENERASAYLAHTYLWNHSMREFREMATQTGLAIEATSMHGYKHDLEKGGQYFLDIDLSILGQSRAVYNEYAKNIRREYAWVPREKYVEARTKILQSFLANPELYRTEYFRNKYDENARKNIQWELGVLPFIE